MMDNERSQQIGWGVFLIGLAILFLTDLFFPGIFFVVGIAMMVSDQAAGKKPLDNIPALALIGIGVLFTTGHIFSLIGNVKWLFFVLIFGVGYLLFKDRANIRRSNTAEPKGSKPKNDYI